MIKEENYYNCEIQFGDILVDGLNDFYVRHKINKLFIHALGEESAYLAARLMDLDYIISDRIEGEK